MVSDAAAAAVAGSPWRHRCARLARAAVTGAVVLFAVLQVAALGRLDPVRTTISDLIFAPGGRWLFPVAGLLMAAGSAAVAVLLTAGRRRGAAALVTLWCAGLLLVTAFPTDPPGAPGTSVPALLHRYAGLVMYLALPLAGWFASTTQRGPAARYVNTGSAAAAGSPNPAVLGAAASVTPLDLRRVRRLSIASAGAGLAFLIGQLPQMMPDSPIAGLALGLRVPGLAERVLFVVLLMLLGAMLRAALAGRAAATRSVVVGAR
jgi:hypothetical protein